MAIISSKPQNPDVQEAERKRALAEAFATAKKDRNIQIFSALLKCAQNALKSDDKDRTWTVIELSGSAWEVDATIKLRLKVRGPNAAQLFRTGFHYALALREPPKEDGKPVYMHLDGEILARLALVNAVGKAAVLDEDADQDEEQSIVEVLAEGIKLTIKDRDRGLLAEELTPHRVLRLVLAPAPEWLEEKDRKRIEEEAEQQRQIEEYRRKPASASKAVHPDQASLPFEKVEA